METGIKPEEWEFSSLSELCGLRFGGKPLLLEIRLETRHAGSGHERVAWLVVQALSLRLQLTQDYNCLKA